MLLQIATPCLLQITAIYYKLRQLLQIATSLLQIAILITNCDNYYDATGFSHETVGRLRSYAESITFYILTIYYQL